MKKMVKMENSAHSKNFAPILFLVPDFILTFYYPPAPSIFHSFYHKARPSTSPESVIFESMLK